VLHHNTGKLCLIAICGLILTGCNTWSSSNVEMKTKNSDLQTTSASAPDSSAEAAPTAAPQESTKSPSDVLITEKDITDRKYETLADLEVTVNKTTIFHADPTKELVAAKLQEEAAKINADAVILVRYGTVGISLFSWGSLDGRGRAIKFVK
tara:strand:+ start:362 stop:817 length:456 start_codon:yes stop_codon:yes gene_type:complete